MATATPTAAPPTFDTIADLLDHLGDLPPGRVRLVPTPGTATETDLLAIALRERRLFELIDGVLVEKTMGYRESYLAMVIVGILEAYELPRDLGLITGPDGSVRLFPGLILIPDVAFVLWARIPDGRIPTAPIPGLVPDLAVEVLSPSNTAREMAIKRGHYFRAGVRLVWIVDPEGRTVDVYRDPDTPTRLDATCTLDGGDVLPGFVLPLAWLFARLDRVTPG